MQNLFWRILLQKILSKIRQTLFTFNYTVQNFFHFVEFYLLKNPGKFSIYFDIFFSGQK